MYDYLTNISSVMGSGVDIPDFANSLSKTQYVSKKWAVEEVVKYSTVINPVILILGGWYGSYLVPMLNESIHPSKIYFNDIDPACIAIAKKLHRKKNIEFYCFDATEFTFDKQVDIVINTSCEHMATYTKMMNTGWDCLFVLQTCDNKNDPGHTNTSATTEDFITKTNMTRISYAARRNLGHKNRFTIVGRN